MTYSLLFINAMAPLREIHRILDELHESCLRVQIYDELLSIPQDKSFMKEDFSFKQDVSSVDVSSNTKIAISIQNISYGYKENTQNKGSVLENM